MFTLLKRLNSARICLFHHQVRTCFYPWEGTRWKRIYIKRKMEGLSGSIPLSSILLMDQISIKTPNPKSRLFWKIYQRRDLAAGEYLSEAPSPPMTPYSATPYTLYTCVYTYSHREEDEGGELTREKVRGAMLHKAGWKYQLDWLSLQSINSIIHQ